MKAAILISALMGAGRKFWGITHNILFVSFLLTNMFSNKPGMALSCGNVDSLMPYTVAHVLVKSYEFI